MNKETLMNLMGEFTWNFGQQFFIETAQGNFIWSDPDYNGDNTIRKYHGTIHDFFPGDSYSREGKHVIGKYCDPMFTLVDDSNTTINKVLAESETARAENHNAAVEALRQVKALEEKVKDLERIAEDRVFCCMTITCFTQVRGHALEQHTCPNCSSIMTDQGTISDVQQGKIKALEEKIKDLEIHNKAMKTLIDKVIDEVPESRELILNYVMDLMEKHNFKPTFKFS